MLLQIIGLEDPTRSMDTEKCLPIRGNHDEKRAICLRHPAANSLNYTPAIHEQL